MAELRAYGSFIFFIFLLANGSAESVSAPSNITWEAEKLLEFKQGLTQTERLRGWNASNVGSVCTSWAGVTCSSTMDTVTGINFTNFNISGYLTEPLCDLPNLSELYLRSNLLTQRFPGFILGSCTKLRAIDFSLNNFYGELPSNISSSPIRDQLEEFNMEGNYFNGSIPADLGNLPQLTLLRLRGNDLSGRIPPELARLSSLVILDLAYNPFPAQEIPSEFSNLSHTLERWDTPGCGLIGNIPNWLGEFTHLVFLNLEYNNLSGSIPPSLVNLSNLTEIYLDRNNLTGPLPPFANLSKLQIIQFQVNSLSGAIPSTYSSLSALTTLILDFNNLTGSLPDGLEKLPNLSTFAVATNDLSGTLSSSWGVYSQIYQFDVSDNLFSGPFPKHLCDGNGLVYLSIKGNSIQGTIPFEYGRCGSIKRFVVNNNQLNGTVPNGLWTLPDIQYIDLSQNLLSGMISFAEENQSSKPQGNLQSVAIDSNLFEGPIPDAIAKFWFNITKFDASQNNLSGPLPQEIGLLAQLEYLGLSNNSISDAIPLSIGGCKSLVSLNLSHNNLFGTIPAALSEVSDLTYLDLSYNQFSGSIPQAIAKTTYNVFNVSYNDLSGSVPTALASTYDSSDFAGNPKLCISAALCSTTSSRDTGTLHKNERLILIITGTIMAVLLCVAITIFFTWRKRAEVEATSQWKMISFQRPTFFEEEIYESLKDANVIGSGASGKVYKVSSKTGGVTIAVKRFNMPKAWIDPQKGRHGGLQVNRKDGSSAFKVEVDTLANVQHKNIVKLIGWCACEDERLLLYEYMINGSLADVLHKDFRSELLNWGVRFHIALGAAEGLAYLHHACEPPILHRDVKSSNILLDAALNSKLADFGVAKSLLQQEHAIANGGTGSVTGVVGSIGYIAPEYGYTSKIDEKSDVYSYGVVLLELLTGRRPIMDDADHRSIDLVKWVTKMAGESKEDFWQVIDGRLELFETDKESVATVLKLALLCTRTLPRLRPSMKEIVEILRQVVPSSMLHCPSRKDDHKDKNIGISIVV
ncbi:hypothetical protein KP509_27G061300 [Ceratopteris richardii]|uniref:non-specific serine/threonine protein kinase n=1 Tax=Ceratopteris richardii TaxID=49495 RepID=A0A8T2RJD5_CERRI|nr:hypothetical protein KP509_27G061300 [Ceratopteris richardii]